MEWFQALILGIIQGLTEFLPISSSGHLTIAQHFFGLKSGEDNLLFDVVVHTATVCSIILILRNDISNLIKGFFSRPFYFSQTTTNKSSKKIIYSANENQNYILKILISMIPVLIIGLFLKDFVENIFGSELRLFIVGICLIITALLLTFANFAKERQKKNITFLDSFIIGIAQMIAILPGLSRSGATIGTGLLLGNKKESVANFSFIMVLIPILGEAFLTLIKIIKLDNYENIDILSLIIAFLSAFIVGCFACKFMLRLVKKGKIIYFGIYCLILGIFLICYEIIC